MGVDYYQCDSCGRGFRDDSEYCAYCDCYNKFCTSKCGKLENYKDEYDEDDGGNRIDPDKDVTCVICRNEKYTDYTLLKAVLQHFNITREQAINIWRSENKK